MWKKHPREHHADKSLLDTSETAPGKSSSTTFNVAQEGDVVNKKRGKDYSVIKEENLSDINKKRTARWLKTTVAPNGHMADSSFNLFSIIPHETELGKLKKIRPSNLSAKPMNSRIQSKSRARK